MLDFFFAGEGLLEALLEFLSSEVVNLTLAGYFAKAMETLFARDNSKVLQ